MIKPNPFNIPIYDKYTYRADKDNCIYKCSTRFIIHSNCISHINYNIMYHTYHYRRIVGYNIYGIKLYKLVKS